MSDQTRGDGMLLTHYVGCESTVTAHKSASFGDSAFIAIDANRHVDAVSAEDDPEITQWLRDQKAARKQILITSKELARELFGTQIPAEFELTSHRE